MSRLDNPEKPAHPLNDHQISRFHELRRLYRGVPASLANSSGIFFAPKAHFDLVRAGAALYGVNPTPGADNPMLPVIELRARIVQVLSLAPGETIADTVGWAAKRPTRLALVSVGYADGYPRSASTFDNKLQAIVDGQRCPVVGHPSMDLLAIDVTDVSDPTAARHGNMVTLVGTGDQHRRSRSGKQIDRSRTAHSSWPPFPPHLLRHLSNSNFQPASQE